MIESAMRTVNGGWWYRAMANLGFETQIADQVVDCSQPASIAISPQTCPNLHIEQGEWVKLFSLQVRLSLLANYCY